KSQTEIDVRDSAKIAIGLAFIQDTAKGCTSCHTFRDHKKDPPDLTGYGSRQWMIDFISDPAHERFFGDNNDRMPSFATEKTLTLKEIGMVADWLRGEWYVPPPRTGAPGRDVKK
ncbi:MAG: hypothetical protein ABI120_20675, partial [Gemmatimonadaceae bacterium]